MCYIPKRVQVLIDNGHKPICVCCGSENDLSFDHIIPLSKKGKDCNTNGQILCKTCNWHKSNELITVTDLRNRLFGN